ncbi:Cytochrome P450 [Mycena venus]|uniref:Cytochrome P450 n=1 Tax=Mycena venus TaxID=2733690 RepID=A0A8H6Z6E2_9AGAR|nr:Cytochrome P450 [Mycena venus]
MDAPSTPVLCIIFFILITLYTVRLRARRHRLPLPPGPPKLPLVGNLFDVPSTFQWKSYARWSKQYDSDIIHLDLAGTSIIVLSSFEATDALFEKRSSLYSDRGNFPMVNELMGWYFNIVLMKYGEEWRIHRRLFQGAFNVEAARKYKPAELVGTYALLARLLHTPEDFIHHFRQMTGEIIMAAVYGIDVLPSNDPYVTLAHKAVRTAAIAAVPGVYLVDTFPILKHIPRWFPGAGFKRVAEEWSKLSRGMLELPFAETKRQMVRYLMLCAPSLPYNRHQDSGVAPPSFTADSLQALNDPDKEPYYKEHHVKQTAAAMYSGGADTTVSALGTFILAMLAYPEVQKTAQAEIDSLTGGKYLPSFEDEVSLPYISALVKEVMRWENVAPFGEFIVVLIWSTLILDASSDTPATRKRRRVSWLQASCRLHCCRKCMVCWAILHDERVYPDPLKFKPERFLLDGKLNLAVRNPDAAFGFGRRRCPGRHMAFSSIWITVVSILATFDITKAVDEKGNVVEPSYEYLSGVISTPVPFKCTIRPRSQETVALIQGAAKGAQRL